MFKFSLSQILVSVQFSETSIQRTSISRSSRTLFFQFFSQDMLVEHFIVYVTHWSVYINMQGDKETLSGFYKSPQVVINKVLSIYNQVWYGSILSIN